MSKKVKHITVKNFRGNIIESLNTIQRKYSNYRIVEAKETDSGVLDVRLNEKKIMGDPSRVFKSYDDYLDSFLNENQLDETHKMTREELDDFLEQLDDGIVEFEFKKKDGTMRKARGTRQKGKMPEEAWNELQELLKDDRANYMIYYFDLDKEAIRQFHVGRFEQLL